MQFSSFFLVILLRVPFASWKRPSIGVQLVDQLKYGSWRESGKVCVLRGFLKSDELGSRGGQPLRF